jgi:NADH-quinone oxidoreductase subunit K
VLFGIGATGLMVRRNPLIMFMCIELMLNAVNLTFVALAVRFGNVLDPITGGAAVDPTTGAVVSRGIDGQTAVFFVLVVAAAEVVVGLGIIISILKRRPGATADDLAELKG